MKAPRSQAPTPLLLDGSVEHALRARLVPGAPFGRQEIAALQALIEDTPPDVNAVQIVLYDLLHDLNYCEADLKGQARAHELVASALAEINAIIETQRTVKAAEAYDLMQANPDRGIPAKDVFEAIRTEHTSRTRRDRS
ncbi:hypothetical protein [Caulobacter sp.]|uniref:hypothetical protein n=1 Tax=Caulobacter sp. TaxID=78 RepID=UPI0016102D4A